ncbi:MAG: hypothetical protein NC355_02775 [Blautia sp.]|nr:hypothetical protein [Blautia sp.]
MRNHTKGRFRFLALFMCLAMLFTSAPAFAPEQVYAAGTTTISSWQSQVVCGKKAKIKLPGGYKNPKYSSSNKKVATVTAKGVVKAVKLGVAKITVKSGGSTTVYTVTVIPAKASQVWLKQQAVVAGRKFKFTLASDKYDTSQVKLDFGLTMSSKIKSTGECLGLDIGTFGELYYKYGTFSGSSPYYAYEADQILNDAIGFFSVASSASDAIRQETEVYANSVYANVPYKSQITWLDYDGSKLLTPSAMKKKGIDLKLDGSSMKNSIKCGPGKHTLSFKFEGKTYKKNFYVSYPVKEVLERRDSTGFSPESAGVLEAAFAAVDSVVNGQMTDTEKAKAIHDYLIYHANYYHGNEHNAERWAYSASGVLLHGEGVCESYAVAFYIMANAAGLQCEYVTGDAWNGSYRDAHAWNRVCIDGTWYYIDCTWDDDRESGHESDNYFMSPTLWKTHGLDGSESVDLAEDGKNYWELYYLTGRGYTNKPAGTAD